MRRCVVARRFPDVSKTITAIIFMGQDSSLTSRSCGWRHYISSINRGPFHEVTQCHFSQKGTSHKERVVFGLLSPAAATYVTCFNIKIVCILPTVRSHFTWLSQSTANDIRTRDCVIFQVGTIISVLYEPRTSKDGHKSVPIRRFCDRPSWHRFSCFSSVFKQTHSWVTTFQVATACVSCSSPDLNVPKLIF
jgi:hypothetical protein